MPIDSSIYGMLKPAQIRDPLEQYGRFAQVKAMVGQSDLQDLQRKELERGIADEGKIRELFARGNVKPEELMAINPKRGFEYQKVQRDAEKSGVDLESAKIKGLREKTAYMRDKLASVLDQNGYNAWREEGMRLFGPDVAGSTPPQFSPDVQRQLLMDADGLLERLAPKPPAGHTMRPDGTLSPVDPNYLKGREAIAKAGATNVKVPVNLAGNKYAETVGTKAGERDIAQHESAQAAVENLDKLNMVAQHLQKSEAITGMGAELLKEVERVKNFVTASEKSGKKVSDTELLDTFLGSDVFPMIKALGIGARGLDTPAEREFLRSVMTGTITMNKATLQKMVEIRRSIAQRAVDKWNKRVEGGELDRYFEFTQSPRQKLEIPAAPPAPRPAPDAPKGIDPSKLSDEELLRELGFGR